MSESYSIQELLDKKAILVHKDGNFGGMYPRKADFKDDGIPFLSAKNIDENGNLLLLDVPLLNFEKANKLTFGWIEDGDVLLSHNASVGKVALYKGEYDKALIGTSLTCFRVEDSMIFPDFLAYVFKSPFFQGQLKKNMGQTTRNQVPITAQKKLKIPLPPLPQQKKIAAILDAADTYRQKTKALIAKYDELAQSLFLDMFGDPVTNPKNFKRVYLKELIVDVKNGLSRRRKIVENIGEIVLRLRDIRENYIDLSEVNRIPLDDNEKAKYSISSSDLLFIRVNGNPEYVGRCAVFTGCNEPIYFNDHIMRVRLNNYINNIFLSHFLNSRFGKIEVKKYRKTSAGQHTINQAGLEKIRLYYPSMDLQNQFAERIQAIEAQKAQVQASLAKSEDLFNSLLQRAFKGELKQSSLEGGVRRTEGEQ